MLTQKKNQYKLKKKVEKISYHESGKAKTLKKTIKKLATMNILGMIGIFD